MVNEFIHTEVGAGMTEAEYDAITAHSFNSQATGDLLYASSTTQLTRLAKGAANTVLVMGATIPAWSATLAGLTFTSPTINGTIATTGLTLPAVTLGGTMTVTGQAFNAGAGTVEIVTTGMAQGLRIRSTQGGVGGALLDMYHDSPTPADNDWPLYIVARGKSDTGVARVYGQFLCYARDVSNGVEVGSWEFTLMNVGIQNIAMNLTGAGALWTDLSVDTLTYKVAGTQVVGARVVDARADDVVDATYGAEEAGVLDALRDAMITHGLISAS